MRIRATSLGGNKLWAKSFYYEQNGQRRGYKVVGVVRNLSYRPPTSEPGLVAFQHPKAQEYLLNRASILFKFREGMWNECRAAIEKLHKEEFRMPICGCSMKKRNTINISALKMH